MRENPLPLLFLFLALAALPSLASAQMERDLVVESEEALLAIDYERISALTEWGPHRKNPLASGRNRILYRVRTLQPVAPPPLRATGPTFKNRRVILRPELPPRRRLQTSQLTGPRYKNHSAKSRG